jgi:hypothetical protein
VGKIRHVKPVCGYYQGLETMAADFSDIFRRIERRRIRTVVEGKPLTERRLSVIAGLSPDFVRSARRNNAAGKQKGISLEVATKLAKVLNTTPEWIMHGVGPEEPGGKKQHKTETIEIRCVWEIVADVSGAVTIEETLGAHATRTWGPMPSRALADQLIVERKGVVERALANLVNEKS